MESLTYIEVIENALANPNKIWMHERNDDALCCDGKIYIRLCKEKMMWQLLHDGKIETIIYLHLDEFSEKGNGNFFIDGWEELNKKRKLK